MFEFFDGIYDNVEIFFIIFLAVSFLSFAIYVLISNRRNRKILIDKENSLRKRQDMIRINFRKNTIKLYDNNKRILVSTYSMEEFKSLIEYKSIDHFNEWIKKIKVLNENIKPSVGVYLFDPKDSSKHYIKLTLLNYLKSTGEAFARMDELNRTLQLPSKLLDNNDFYQSINNLSGLRKKSISGVICFFKITNMNFLRKRYGNENANILLGEMFNRIAVINNKEETFATYLQGNIFCVFQKDIKDRRQAKSYVSNLIDELADEPVDILGKQVEPTINANYTLYGEKSYDLKSVINSAIKSLERTSFKLSKKRFVYYDGQLDNDALNQNKEIEKVHSIIDNDEFMVSYEPILCLEQMNVLGYIIHTRFNIFSEEDNFLTIYNFCEKYGLRNEFLIMYYRHIFNECIKSNSRHYRMVLKVDLLHIDIIKNVWLENPNHYKIHLILAFNYEDIIHPKKQVNFTNLMNELNELRIQTALIADENMLTIISNVVFKVDMIIFDEFLISNIEANDLKQISIDNIINNTQTNKVKYIALGINKYEQAEVLNKIGVDNLVGPYISKSQNEIGKHDFLKNRSVQALNNLDM